MTTNFKIEEFNNGSEIQFNWVYNTYYRAIVNYAGKLVYDYEAARDITANAFTKLWIKRTDFEALDKITGFLYRFVHDKAVNYNIHKERRKKNENQIQKQFIYQDLRKHVENRDLLKVISQAACEDDFDKRIWQLLISGFDYKEIAGILGNGASTIIARRQRFVEKVKERFSIKTQHVTIDERAIVNQVNKIYPSCKSIMEQLLTGATIQSIADQKGLPVRTIRRTAARGIQILRNNIAARNQQEETIESFFNWETNNTVLSALRDAFKTYRQ